MQTRLVSEFLADPRHHIAVASEAGQVVGFVSAVDYVHPDKPRELFINEVGVAPTHQRQGLAKRLLHTVLEAGRAAGCRQAWVLTERSNVAAIRLYGTCGGVEAPDLSVMVEFPLDPVPPSGAPGTGE